MKPIKRNNSHGFDFKKQNVEAAYQFFDKDIRFKNLFVNYNTPTFIIRYRISGYKIVMTLNPILKDLNFHTQLDPYTCYQEIAMYVSGVLGVGEKEIIKISDVEKRNKAGFDDVSFKQVSPGKKFKRRNNS